MSDAALSRLVDAAPIVGIRSREALRWLCRAAPLGHRWFPLLRRFLPESGLIPVPCGRGSVLYPAAWVGPFSVGYLLDLDATFPEQRLFQSALAASPGGVVVDVGANLGVYILLTRQVTEAPIVAFEPSPLAFHLVTRMTHVNQLSGIEIRERACGERDGRICLQEGVNSYVGGAAGGAQPDFAGFDERCRHARDGFTAIDVDQVTLDDEMADRAAISLIKIDCEGFERRVLLGATRLLATQRPTLFIELHPELIRQAGDTPEGVCEILKDASYDVECWNFQRLRAGSRAARFRSRYRTATGHRYASAEAMLADLPISRPQQVYLVATPAERRAHSRCA